MFASLILDFGILKNLYLAFQNNSLKFKIKDPTLEALAFMFDNLSYLV